MEKDAQPGKTRRKLRPFDWVLISVGGIIVTVAVVVGAFVVYIMQKQ